ncbi:MAG: ROK family protein [Mariprofundaceae bacterium]|nr:ROK family protein [Mariprofundaceae bacterium]
MSKTCIALDVGGTNIRAAIIDAQGKILQQHSYTAQLSQITGNQQEVEQQVIEHISANIEVLLGQGENIQHVGIGFPGFFDNQQGHLIASPNMPVIHNFDLSGQLSKKMNLTVSAQNDALCAAMGEFHYGVGQSSQSLMHITLGTGVGAGLVIQGQAYGGDRGMAMEFGHLRMAKTGDYCGCGNIACLETFASATAVLRRFNDHSQTSVRTAQEVYQLAKEGDALAKLILSEAGNYLGSAIAEASKLLDIKHISISGGLCGAWDMIYPYLRQSMEAALIPPMRNNIIVQQSSLGDDAGLLGAAALVNR